MITQKKKKKIVINQEGETVEVDPEKPMSDVKEARVVTYQERRKRAINLRRRLPKLKRARELALKRVAGKKKIKKRSQNLARNYMRRRLAGKMGASYQQLSPSDKIVVDKMISPRQQAIVKLANRLIPSVKRAETTRLLAGKRASTYNIRPISASTEYDKPILEQIAKTYDLIEKKKMKGEDPCWDGYEMIGHKTKNGQKVPNCVPKQKRMVENIMKITRRKCK